MKTCEKCGKEPARSLSCFWKGKKKLTGNWFLTGMCTADTEDYYIEFRRLKEMDWLEHLQEKVWFDWLCEASFMRAIHRLNPVAGAGGEDDF